MDPVMPVAHPAVSAREPRTEHLSPDLCVIGGGMAGACCAITAAREGLKVVLIQDRPVLGGNASSEVRLWLLGATTHMSRNNRWSREGGVINEIMVENLYRNREGNPLIFDTVILEKVVQEPNITLLLNTAVHSVEKADGQPDHIAAVEAFCSQNSTRYICRAPLFCDASGDGIVGFLAGAGFRMGAESKNEFGEEFAPSGEFGHLLGHSIYFYTRDTGQPVTFVAPSYALKDVPGRIPRYRQFNTKDHGCRLWWIEWGGRLDTVHETETIKWELWRIVYGVWDYIKNSGNFPDAANLTLDWVGCIPGKRESRRFEGDYILTQADIVERRQQPDAVAFGGWSIDLHPADGVFAERAGSHHLYSKGIYPIPYRCYYSRNIENLFLAGRLISSSHVAFGSTRVMATCALGGQAVAVAAALCRQHGVLPRAVPVGELQTRLLRTGQHLIGVPLRDSADMASEARLSASSEYQLTRLPADGDLRPVSQGVAQMLPLPAGRVPVVTFLADVAETTTVRVELRATSDPRHHTPDTVLAAAELTLAAGQSVPVPLAFDVVLPEPAYGYYAVMANPHVCLRHTQQRVTGLLTVWKDRDPADFRSVGGEIFDWWKVRRRPEGQNLACTIEPALPVFGVDNLKTGFVRPTHSANAWVADPADPAPSLTLTWDRLRDLRRIEVWFDPDYDHAMETVLWGHPESVVPFMVKSFSVFADDGQLVARVDDNHDTRRVLEFSSPVTTRQLQVVVHATHGAPAAIFDVRCYQ